MTLLEVYDCLRHTNIGLGVLVTLLLLLRVPAWVRAPWPSKVGRLCVFGWVTSTTFGTVEALSQSAVPGLRIPAVTSMMVLSGYYVWCEWRDDRRQRAAIAAVLGRDSTKGP